MTDQILGKLDSVNAATVFVVFIVIFFVISWAISKRSFLKETWDSFQNRRKRKEELLQLLLDTAKKADEANNHIKDYEEKRVHDREQSLKIQKEFITSINVISAKLDEMKKDTEDKFEFTQEQQNKRVRADLKDKIGQSYRYYHEKGKWNDMEKEALEELIESYENAKGDNSFVHSVVAKEMYTWDLIPRN